MFFWGVWFGGSLALGAVILYNRTMNRLHENLALSNPLAIGRWQDLASRVLEGHRLCVEEGLAVLRAGDEELLDLLAAAYRVRYRWFGNRGPSELAHQREVRGLRRGLRLLLAVEGIASG